jgi:hypothetical protein
MITATVTGGAVQLTGNPVIINCSGGSVPSGASEYMILLQILSPDGKLEGAPLISGSIPYPDGSAIFDISGILDQPVEVSFDSNMTEKILTHPTQAFNIQVQPGERYIDAQGLLKENWFAVSDIFQMIKGGLSPRQNTMMKALGQTYYSKYVQGKKFLSPRPWGDFVHPNQPVKLWFMPAENKTVYLEVRAYFNDNNYQNKHIQVDIDTDTLLEINCNPALHGFIMETVDNIRIEYFEVYFAYGGLAYSDVRRFQVDWNYCERPYFLFFANSLGGIDDVFLRGFGVDSFDVTGTQAYRPVRTTDTVFTPTIVSPNKTGQNKWKINSGWKDISTIQFYRDLMLSKQAWFLYPGLNNTSTIIIPVIIQNSDGQLTDRQEDQWNIDIEFIEAHSSRFSFDNRSF